MNVQNDKTAAGLNLNEVRAIDELLYDLRMRLMAKAKVVTI